MSTIEKFWHWTALIAYTYALLHLVYCWRTAQPPEFTAVVILIEGMWYQLFVYSYKLWHNKT